MSLGLIIKYISTLQNPHLTFEMGVNLLYPTN
ncbi:hypothetical protein SAMN05216498_1469 [Tenuibacillus multivorans]|uniref:Uncharacterized protein n=1 Tax=Tenuibacillus multivorans TaxID=237069 RepID=A0A1G9YNQ4_9BACI|nr:hypothetical protein SAMN05216498_1469 [Tenuibacillus multivorans]